MMHPEITNQFREDFLAHICSADNSSTEKVEHKDIKYFVKRLDGLSAQAQLNGLSEEVLFEILSYDSTQLVESPEDS